MCMMVFLCMLMTLMHGGYLGEVVAKGEGVGVPEMQFVQDFVDFYNIKQVCLLQEETNSWILKLLRRSSVRSFTSIVGLKTQDNGSRLNASSHPSARAVTCRGLRIMVLRQEEDKILFRKIFTGAETKENWLLISDGEFHELLKSTYLPLDNMVRIANFGDDKQTATIWETYQVGEAFEQRLTTVGRWTRKGYNDLSNDSSPNGTAVTSTPLPPNGISISTAVTVKAKTMNHGVLEAPVDDPMLRRNDLSGLHIKCTSIEYSPFTILKYQDDGTMHIGGIFGKIFDLFQEITNFTYTCYKVPDNQWGAHTNGRWSGMVGEIARGEADVAVAPLSITQQRSLVADFLLSIMMSGYSVAMKRPTNEDYLWTVYTKQFEATAWIVTVVLAIATTAFVFVLLRLSRREESVTPSLSAFTVLGILFGQVSMNHTNSKSHI
ncbi:glutamate receptor ionotropic, NMDA 2A-like [Penaeus japonicus]|uniref:glutamate receptor ionotropic, NMDA 2A-like n=1 Tax=Penaeus japonicus TaxID=27405 RepID=UPI001C70C7E6|nr:glutamate receptor ionotropic, NMDA 2A-like [Penaeus japonicus]